MSIGVSDVASNFSSTFSARPSESEETFSANTVPTNQAAPKSGIASSGFAASKAKAAQAIRHQGVLDSGINRQRSSQRRALGKDVRYHMKDLVSASAIGTDDFFSGNFNTGALTTQAIQPVQVKKSAFNRLLDKQDKDSQDAYDENTPDYPNHITYPLFSVSDMFPTNQARRLKAKKAGLTNQLKQYLIDHSEDFIPADQFGGHEQLVGKVVVIERQRGFTSLICKMGDEEKEYFKILLNPILTKIDVTVGDTVQAIGITKKFTFVKHEHGEPLVKFLVVPQFLVNQSAPSEQ